MTMRAMGERVLGYGSETYPAAREVRGRYFDPRTGLPCDEKPVPLHEGSSQRMKRHGLARLAVMSTANAGKPVLLDGERYETIREAAAKLGVSETTLGAALRRGDGEFRGREISYADGGRK